MIRGVGMTVTIGDEMIVTDVDLDVEPGEMVALVGSSGAGKSTLLSVLFGAVRLSAGELVGPSARGWHDLAIVPQDLGLAAELTLRENVELPARLAHLDLGRVDDLLAELDVQHVADRLPDEVSLGEQQRSAVARALVLEPSVVLLDEPTAHQDERRSTLVVEALRAVADRGAAVLVSTHDDDVIAACDRSVELALD